MTLEDILEALVQMEIYDEFDDKKERKFDRKCPLTTQDTLIDPFCFQRRRRRTD